LSINDKRLAKINW